MDDADSNIDLLTSRVSARNGKPLIKEACPRKKPDIAFATFRWDLVGRTSVGFGMGCSSAPAFEQIGATAHGCHRICNVVERTE